MSNFRNAAVAVTALVAASGSALADGRVWMQDASGRYNGSDNSGGAFIMHRIGTSGASGFNIAQNNPGYVGSAQSGLAAGSFYTFCIERSENVNLANSNGNNNRYYVQIADSAQNGGNGTSNAQAAGPRSNGAGEDVISYATAKIYQEFRNGGNFGGVGSISGAANDQAGRELTSAVQWAIWYAENEMTTLVNNVDSNPNNDYINSNNTVGRLAFDIFMWAQANHGNTLGNVRVARMWTGFNASTGEYSGNSQDQLTLIPLPNAASLAGLGLLVVGARRRRSR